MKDIKDKKEIADELAKIDIRVLKRERFLKSGQTINGTLEWEGNKIGISISLYGNNNRYINLEYTKHYYYTGEKKEFDCPRGAAGCFACRPFEKILKGEAEFIGVGGYGQEMYMIP